MTHGLRKMSKSGEHANDQPVMLEPMLSFSYHWFWHLIWYCREIALLVVTVGCYLSTFAFSGVLFMWFNPSGHDCGLNMFFIVMTIILSFAFAIIALHPQVTYFFYLLPSSIYEQIRTSLLFTLHVPFPLDMPKQIYQEYSYLVWKSSSCSTIWIWILLFECKLIIPLCIWAKQPKRGR